MTKTELAALIDHTFLKPTGKGNEIAKLCREARKFGFASVCVNPCEVRKCAKALKGTSTKVCTVIDFPLGQGDASAVVCSAVEAIAAGARELDYVINVRLLKEAAAKGGKSAAVAKLAADLQSYNELPRDFAIASGITDPIVTKLIIECCYLTREEKVLACRLAKKAGFDFVKTSTGFGTGGATVEDVKLMRRTVGPEMGVKAAGGIRTLDDALAMVMAGANRLGCSAGVEIVEAL